MKIYNVGSEMFSFTHGGTQFDIKPKHGTFERQREKYSVTVEGDNQQLRNVFRFKDVWVKVSDEGTNNNYVNVPSLEFFDAAFKQAVKDERREDIKKEGDIVEQEQNRIAAIETKNKKLEAELVEREKEIALKLAMLKRVEEEAVQQAVAKRKV